MKSENLKILYVVTHMPCPPRMGAHHRVLNIGRQLKKCGSVTMVYAGGDFSSESLEATRREFGEIIVMKPALIKGQDAISRIRYKFNFHWPWHCAYQVSRAEKEQFAELQRDHDITWFHTLSAAYCFGSGDYGPSIMDLDDLNQLKFVLKAGIDRGVRLKVANCLLVYKWKRLERHAVNQFSRITVCSAHDKATLCDHENISIIPNGFVPPREEPHRGESKDFYLGFIGNLHYGPNRDGLKWFSEEIWTLITDKLPRTRLRIVGPPLKNAKFLHQPGFDRLGYLDDTGPEIAQWSAMIVPLRYGGGTRLKIVEALSKKCPIVSTPVGAHGLDLTHGENILMAEQPRAFADFCIDLLQDTNHADKMAEAGWELFVKKYTWDIIGEDIKVIVEKCAALSRP